MRSSQGPHPRATFRQPQLPEIHRRYRLGLPNYRPGDLCRPPLPGRPSFVVELLSNQRSHRGAEIDTVIAKCKFKPERVEFSPANLIVVSLFYTQWVHALEAIVCLWESRLDRVHNLTPKLNRFVSVPSDLVELQDRLRGLFTERIKKLMDGEEVNKWEAKRALLSNEFERVSKLLQRPHPVWTLNDLAQKKKRNKCEMELVESKIREFKSAMNCLLAYLDGKRLEECGNEGVQVFKFSNEVYDWSRIQSIMARECHRLAEGLPIYAYRQQILQQILTQQV